MFLHIDGDIIVYRAGFAAEKQQWFLCENGQPVAIFYKKKDAEAEIGEREGFTVEKGERVAEPLKNAIWAAKMIMQSIEKRFPERSGVRVYLSGGENFRDEVATVRKYKGNRDETAKPVHGPKIKEWLDRRYDTSFSMDEEADDEMAYNHYEMYEEDEHSSVIVTLDKDLNMIPGLHYNFVTEEFYSVHPDSADWFFWKQMLMGDPVDNIEGVPGIGDKRATKILGDAEVAELPGIVKGIYKDAFHSEWRARMIEFGQLLWIRRKRDELWMIPKELEE